MVLNEAALRLGVSLKLGDNKSSLIDLNLLPGKAGDNKAQAIYIAA